MFRREFQDIDFRISVITQVLVYCILLGLPVLYFLFVFDINVDTTLYYLADNLLLLMIPLGIALVTLRDVTYVHQYENFNRRAVLAVFIGSFALSFVSIWRVHNTINMVTLLYSLLISANISMLNILTLKHYANPTTETRRGRTLPVLYIALFLILLISYLIHQFALDNPVSQLGLVPIIILFVPGLALVNALLPTDTQPLEILVKSVPVSLGYYAILSAWSFQLGIPLTANAFYSFAGAAIVIGLTLIIRRENHQK